MTINQGLSSDNRRALALKRAALVQEISALDLAIVAIAGAIEIIAEVSRMMGG